MLYRELGKSGIKVSAVGMGTWAIGGTWWGGTDEKSAIAALHAGLDAGLNLIDTAPVYGFGRSEEIVGRALQGRPREQVVLATKVGLAWHGDQGQLFFERDRRRVFRNLRPESIRYEAEQSLHRLGTDYLDLYQTHWQDPTTPIADTMEALLALQQEGKIRAIGVSNCDLPQMQQYLTQGPLASNQPLYNMLDREIEAELLPFCHQQGIGVLSYSSLALGLLTGKMTPARQFGPGDQRAGKSRFAPEQLARINAMLQQLAPWREQYGLDQTQLSIAWALSRPGMTTALVGVRNPAQATTAAGGAVLLPPADLEAMDRVIEALGPV